MSDRAVLFTEGTCTTVDSTEPDQSHGGLPYARMKKDETVLLIREGIGNIPTGAVAAGWTQTFRAVDDFGGGSVTFKLYRLAESWNSDTLWEDRPGFTADTPVSLTGAVTAGGLLSFPTTTLDALEIANPNAGHGFGLVLDTAGVEGHVYMFAPDGALGPDVSPRPTHGGEYQVPPPAPLYLAPSGGRAVGESKPVVRADFGDTAILAVQFHYKAFNTGFTPAGGFSSPTFDSGTVLASDPSLDLSATAFGGFSGTAGYWTMRVKNTDNSWSLYATPVATRFVAPPTVTSTVAGTVGSIQPPITWTHTGTQTSYEVITFDATQPSVATTDSGIRQGTALTFTPTVTVDGETWFLPDTREATYEIRVFDNVTDREETPGCPIYGVATGTFVYADDLTADKPAGVLVSQVGSSPWNIAYVSFGSELASTDRIVLVRDDEHIGRYGPAELAPPDIGEGTVTYAIPDYEAKPFTDHIYGAKLDSGGRTSGAELYLFTAREVTGLWAVDKATGVYSQHSGMSPSLTVADQAGILTGLGQAFPVVQIVAAGGKTGTFGGVVTDCFGETAVFWEKQWKELAHHPAEVQLAYANSTFPAWIWDVNIEPDTSLPNAISRKIVTFQFAQTGLEHLGDPPGGPGQSVITADFESLTDGVTVPTAGVDDVLSRTGSPQSKASAVKHGVMGVHLAPNQGLTWLLRNFTASTDSVYLRITANTEAGPGSHTFLKFNDVNGAAIGELKVKPSGRLLLEQGATTLALSQGKITFGATSDDWLRIDFTQSWDGATARIQFAISTEDESNTYSDVLAYPIAAVDQPYSFSFLTGTELALDMDTVRRGSDASAVMGALNPDADLPVPQLILVGAPL